MCSCNSDSVKIDMRLFRHLVPAKLLPAELFEDTSSEEGSASESGAVSGGSEEGEEEEEESSAEEAEVGFFLCRVGIRLDDDERNMVGWKLYEVFEFRGESSVREVEMKCSRVSEVIRKEMKERKIRRRRRRRRRRGRRAARKRQKKGTICVRWLI